MANPNLKDYTSQKDWAWGVVLPGTTGENLIGNASGSNSIIKVDVWGWNVDGLVSVDVTLDLRNAAGTPICSVNGNGAITGISASNDVLAGTTLGGPTKITLPANTGMQFIRRYTLNEAMSLVATATNGGDAGIWIDFSVFA